MRRALSIALALAALLATGALVGLGLRCGMKSVSASCFSTEECDAKSECQSYVHPFAPLYAVLSLGGLAGVLLRQPLVPLGLGVLGAGLGALVGLSLGPWGIGIGLLLVAAGIAGTTGKKPARLVAWAALPAALLPTVLILLVMTSAPPALHLAIVWAIALGPALGWAFLAAVMHGRAR